MTKTAKERVERGLCPQCGGEAAPYYLCSKCRLKGRFARCLKRGARLGMFLETRDGRGFRYSKAAGIDDKKANAEYMKWATPLNMPDSDRRSLPRLRGHRVDVERTLIEVMTHLGRPSTTEEIMAAWGKLRGKRTDPLAGDLARIIAADDKRKRRAEKLMAINP